MNQTQTSQAGERTQEELERIGRAMGRRATWLAEVIAATPVMERIVAALPDEIAQRCNTGETTVQLSGLPREHVVLALRAIPGGRWEKKISHYDGGTLDYECEIEGVRVLLFAAEPPLSCRIETEEVEVPAHKEIRRKVVCA